MSDQEKIEKLLHEYGYPENVIHQYIKDTKNLDYDELEKSIMPYQDITAKRS